MKNKLKRMADSKGITTEKMMEDMLAADMTVREMCNRLNVAPGTIHGWLRANGYHAVEVVTVKWQKDTDEDYYAKQE